MSIRESSESLRHYTSLPVEILVVTLSLAPILLLIYFYPILPDRIPVFLNLQGEVEKWAVKGVASVFRVPAMAIDLQLLALLMKYATVRSKSVLLNKEVGDQSEYEKRITALSTRLWDTLRLFIGVKMAAESLSILFLDNDRFPYLKILVRVTPWIVAVLAIVVALVYGWRLIATKREMKKSTGHFPVATKVDREHLLAGFLYYNADDSAPFVGKYVFNFANRYVYLLIACIVAYPVLVFWPV